MLHLREQLRLSDDAAMDAACEIIHLMMKSGTVIPALVEAYEAAPLADEDDNDGLQALTSLV